MVLEPDTEFKKKNEYRDMVLHDGARVYKTPNCCRVISKKEQQIIMLIFNHLLYQALNF
jgi:hypothetical protein